MSEEMVNYQVSPEMATQKQEIKTGDIQDQITSLIPLAGTIELTPDQEAILYAPVDPGSVEIRSDGLIYLPWMEYVARLRGAFGMSWTLIPYGPPKKMGNFIHWAFWLIIRGKPYGFAVGEQAYFENGRMTYGDALEGCKSNALMRLCKGLGISNELWRPSFVQAWKSKYAEVYGKDNKGKDLWRKKGVGPKLEAEEEKDVPVYPVPQESKPKGPSGQQSSPDNISDAQRKRFYAIAKGAGKSDEEMKAYLGGLGIEHSKDIPKAKYDEICKWAEFGDREPGDEENAQ